jgi:hypothetical protein
MSRDVEVERLPWTEAVDQRTGGLNDVPLRQCRYQPVSNLPQMSSSCLAKDPVDTQTPPHDMTLKDRSGSSLEMGPRFVSVSENSPMPCPWPILGSTSALRTDVLMFRSSYYRST